MAKSRPSDQQLAAFCWRYDTPSVERMLTRCEEKLASLGRDNLQASPFPPVKIELGSFDEAAWIAWVQSIEQGDEDDIGEIERLVATCRTRLGYDQGRSACQAARFVEPAQSPASPSGKQTEVLVDTQLQSRLVDIFTAVLSLQDKLEPVLQDLGRANSGLFSETHEERNSIEEELGNIGGAINSIPSPIRVELEALAQIMRDTRRKCVTIPDMLIFLARSGLRKIGWAGWQAVIAAKPENQNLYPWAPDRAPSGGAGERGSVSELHPGTTGAIFVCYAHVDNEGVTAKERWLDRLLEHLVPVRLQHDAVIWSDRELESGDTWHETIQAQLQAAKAGVLLVSPSFLASTYIRNSELPVLLKRRKDSGLLILPLLVRPCLFNETTFRFPDPKTGPDEFSLACLQAAVSPEKTLIEMTFAEQERALLGVAQRLLKLVRPQL
jgi:hypothetical protein